MAGLPSLAGLDDLSERLGVTFGPEAPDSIRAQRALDDASALIRAEAGTDWNDEPVPPVIVAIAMAVAIRAFKNPDGASQASVGDVSLSFGSQAAGNAIYLTRQEVKAIRRLAGRNGVDTIQLTSELMLARDPLYTRVVGSDEPIPIGPLPFDD